MSASWALDVRRAGMISFVHIPLNARSETSAKASATRRLRAMRGVRDAYLSRLRADGEVIAQWFCNDGRWVANL